MQQTIVHACTKVFVARTTPRHSLKNGVRCARNDTIIRVNDIVRFALLNIETSTFLFQDNVQYAHSLGPSQQLGISNRSDPKRKVKYLLFKGGSKISVFLSSAILKCDLHTLVSVFLKVCSVTQPAMLPLKLSKKHF